jgi:hypothetical protein
VKVLYIGGFGRSGSTLVERILGQLPGFCSAGEIVFLWQRGLIENQLCGRGATFSECDFWTRVGKTAWPVRDGTATPAGRARPGPPSRPLPPRHRAPLGDHNTAGHDPDRVFGTHKCSFP